MQNIFFGTISILLILSFMLSNIYLTVIFSDNLGALISITPVLLLVINGYLAFVVYKIGEKMFR